MASSYSMYIQEKSAPVKCKTSAAEKAQQRKQAAIIISVMALVAAGVLAINVGKAIASRPPAANSANVAAVFKYAASDNFDSMPLSARQPYLDRWEQMTWDQRRELMSKMSDQDRFALFNNMRNARLDKQVVAYFKLPPGAKRTAFLEDMMKNGPFGRRPTTRPTTMPTTRPGLGAGGPGGRGGGRGGFNNPAAQRQNAQSGDAAMKGMRTQMFSDMMSLRVSQGGGIGFGGGRGGR